MYDEFCALRRREGREGHLWSLIQTGSGGHVGGKEGGRGEGWGDWRRGSSVRSGAEIEERECYRKRGGGYIFAESFCTLFLKGISVRLTGQNHDFLMIRITEKNHFLVEKKDQGLVAGWEEWGGLTSVSQSGEWWRSRQWRHRPAEVNTVSRPAVRLQ